MQILEPLLKAIGFILAFFYSLFPNPNYGLGIAIILLTCTVMLIVFPITAKQTRSMIAMQRVQPELKKIQQRYKDDKDKQREEIMKFYSENKVNPLSGCLPLLLQMPVFIALYRVLHNPQKYVPSTGRFNELYQAICGTGSTCQDPTNHLHFLSMDLTTAAKNAGTVTNGFLGTLPYFILVGLVILTGWYQARQTMARQQRTNPNTPINPQMQLVTKVMPIAFGFISLNIAAGVVLYFITSNVWRIGQQQLVLNKYYEQAAAEAEKAKAKPPKPDIVVDDAAPPVKSVPRPGSPRKRSSGGNRPRGDQTGAGKATDASTPKPKPGSPPKTGSSSGSGNGSSASGSNPNGSSNGAGGSSPSPSARRKKKRKR